MSAAAPPPVDSSGGEPGRSRFDKATLPDVYGHREHYEAFSYSGAAGLLMNLNHRLMERGIAPSQNEHVLDVGGTAMPHWHWMNLDETRSYYFLDDPANLHRQAIPSALEHADVQAFHYADPGALEAIPQTLTRVVASHVLEHIGDPEEALLSWCRLLRDDGVISIAIPCDPGWTWRLLQHISYRSAAGTLGFTSRRERDLFQARDHVTSASNILKVVRYYFPEARITWFPSFVPVIDLNALCIISASMKSYRFA